MREAIWPPLQRCAACQRANLRTGGCRQALCYKRNVPNAASGKLAARRSVWRSGSQRHQKRSPLGRSSGRTTGTKPGGGALTVSAAALAAGRKVRAGAIRRGGLAGGRGAGGYEQAAAVLLQHAPLSASLATARIILWRCAFLHAGRKAARAPAVVRWLLGSTTTGVDTQAPATACIAADWKFEWLNVVK